MSALDDFDPDDAQREDMEKRLETNPQDQIQADEPREGYIGELEGVTIMPDDIEVELVAKLWDNLGCSPKNKHPNCDDMFNEAYRLIDQYANQRALELLDELVQELPVSERMAWSDEDGSHMETKVFQTNMKAWIDAKRLNLTKEQP